MLVTIMATKLGELKTMEKNIHPNRHNEKLLVTKKKFFCFDSDGLMKLIEIACAR